MSRPSLTSLLVGAVLLAGCGGGDDGDDVPLPEQPPVTASPGTGPSAAPVLPVKVGGVAVRDAVASGLETPAAVAFLPDGSALVPERDTGRVLRVTDDGEVGEAGRLPDVVADGEGGLLGLAVAPEKLTRGRTTVFAYHTGPEGNRVVRLRYADGRLGTPDTILDDMPAGDEHNGGALAVGDDGKLYVGTGDAGEPSRAQERASLGGKVLRVGLDGKTPRDNPFRGSPVWSLGHRDVAGLAFDARGTLWATDAGQPNYRELNRVRRGANYGWPVAEGRAADRRYEPAYFAWRRGDGVSPHGLAVVRGVAYVADLDGGTLWKVPLTGGGRAAAQLFGGLYGPLRGVVAAPSGQLWLLTSNRAGNGSAEAGDDRVIRLSLDR